MTCADVCTGVNPDIARFVRILAATTPGNAGEGLTPVPARAADEIMSSSMLLERLLRAVPEITVGPLLHAEQYWLSTGRHLRRGAAASALDRTYLVELSELDSILPSTKPFGIGLYTSTGIFGSFGMWWAYMQLHAGSTLFPPPWTIWSVEPVHDANVLEITTASEWVDFVLSHPDRMGGLLYPNWKSAEERWDGIHMTARAIAATQGIRLSADNNDAIAPHYWDVESTFWLRWRFARAERIDAQCVNSGADERTGSR